MKFIASLVVLCILLGGCTSQPSAPPASLAGSEPAQAHTQPLTPDSLDRLLEFTNARRAAIVKPAPDISQVAGWAPREAAPPVGLSMVTFTFEPDISETATYSLEQAREDVECLFYYYEIGYGPYFYFGGSEAFDAAKAAILSELEAMPEITVPALQESMLRHLSFVKDAHFAINQISEVPLLQGYLSERAFLRDTAGFTDIQSGSRLIAVEGNDSFTHSMALSVTPEGDIVYRYMVLAADRPEAVELTFEGGERLVTALYDSHEATGKPAQSEELVSLNHVDGIPIITVRQMGFPHAKDDWESGKFLELAEQLKDEPVLIIDLRANGGGNGLLPQMFYEKLTGRCVTPNHYSLKRLITGPEEPEPDPDSFYYIPRNIVDHYTKPKLINDGWKLENAELREVVERNPLLIVLTSKSTASSAENFTDLTFNLQNSLVIGCNTTGMMLSSASVGVRAPNTGAVGQMGFNLAVYAPEHFQEGAGIMPDLWAGSDALEAALALARKYAGNAQ